VRRVAVADPLWYKRAVSIIAPCLVLLLGAPEMGVLLVEGGEPGAAVSIDGQAVGALPLPGPWTLPAGAHTVLIGTSSHAVKVAAGAPSRLKLGGARGGGTAAGAADQPVVVVGRPGFSLATAGYIAGGLGVVALGLGVYFGLDASDLADQAKALDRSDPAHTRAELDGLASDAEHQAFTANLLYGAGGVLLASGAALFLLSSDGPLSGAPVAVTPAPGGLVVGGRF